ncbi:MAG: hypothetical protein JST11_08940 [Acidobacteria bacterium]|nr:hypothetical protein [Acidobacteriota bacterium]
MGQERGAEREDKYSPYICMEPGVVEVIPHKQPGGGLAALVPSISLQEDRRPQPVLSREVFGCADTAESVPVVAVLLDRTSFLPGGLQPDTQALKLRVRHLLRDLPADAPVAVYSYGNGGRADFDVLRDVLVDGSGVRVVQAPQQDVQRALSKYDMMPRLNTHSVVQFDSLDMVSRTLEVLQGVGNHLAAIHGRKALVWVAPALSMAADQGDSRNSALWLATMAALERADMAIYPVPETTAARKQDRWAEFTGGRTFYGGEPSQVVKAADADCRCFARLTWKRSCSGDRGVHTLTVAAGDRSNASLIARRYVFDAPRLISSQARLRAAEAGFETPLEATGLAIEAHTESQTATFLRCIVKFDPRQLAPLTTGGDTSVLDIIFAFFDSNGERLASGSRAEIRVPSRGLASHRQSVPQSIELPAGAAELRVVARDAGSGAIGSRAIRVGIK